jgi:iron complex outermembrane recepter protein
MNWRSVGGSPIDATLFMTNATNKLYRVSNGNLYNAFNLWETVYGEPRMYGLRLRYRFGQQ